jgi:hypothetical protein
MKPLPARLDEGHLGQPAADDRVARDPAIVARARRAK